MNVRPYSRPERYGRELKKLMGEIISRELDTTEVGFVTVTAVQMTNDLKMAKVYVSILNRRHSREEIEQYFRARAKFLRGFLGHHLTSKSIPLLKFYYDNSEEEAERIDRLIEEIHSHEVRK